MTARFSSKLTVSLPQEVDADQQVRVEDGLVEVDVGHPDVRVEETGGAPPTGTVGRASRRYQGKAATTNRCTCRECGGTFVAKRTTRIFCCAACRQKFANRMMRRGGQMYSLVMALRHDRNLAKETGAWALLCRMAAAFRDEDLRERGGRASWDDPAAVRARHTYLQATLIGTNLAGKCSLGLVREVRR